MKKRTLIILGHPNPESYCGTLADHYATGARNAGSTVETLALADLTYDIVLHRGYREIQELEPDLTMLQEKIRAADHLVFVYPTWWGGPPALLTGTIERMLLPGFGFKYHKNSPLWDKLLKGKSARIITTMDSPYLYYLLAWGAPGDKLMKHAVLKFCGISPVRFTHVDRLRFRSDAWRKEMLEKVEQVAAGDAHS